MRTGGRGLRRGGLLRRRGWGRHGLGGRRRRGGRRLLVRRRREEGGLRLGLQLERGQHHSRGLGPPLAPLGSAKPALRQEMPRRIQQPEAHAVAAGIDLGEMAASARSRGEGPELARDRGRRRTARGPPNRKNRGEGARQREEDGAHSWDLCAPPRNGASTVSTFTGDGPADSLNPLLPSPVGVRVGVRVARSRGAWAWAWACACAWAWRNSYLRVPQRVARGGGRGRGTALGVFRATTAELVASPPQIRRWGRSPVGCFTRWDVP